MVNPFKVNDNNKQDELYISFLSDTVDQMFRCGPYFIDDGGMIDFQGLVLPCNDYVALSLIEDDVF
jgi:hypothetical protein